MANVHYNDEIHKQIEIAIAGSSMTIKQFVEEALKEKLEKEK